jgi:hypothetical protein
LTDREQATLPVGDDENGDDVEILPIDADVAEESPDEPPAMTEAPPAGGESPEGREAGEPSPWAESIGALVLGALPADEAAAVAREIARSPSMRAEVAALLPVADILMNLYQTQPAPAPVEASPAAGAVTESPPTRRESPPSTRVRPISRPATARPRLSPFAGIAPAQILIGALAIAASLGVLWALALSDRIATRDDEIEALKRQVAQLQEGVNASTFPLSPSNEAPEGARGTVFYSIADAKVLIDVTGLAELEEDRVYQVWFQRSGSTEWEPGPTFQVNPQGEAVQRLAGETPSFIRIAVSEEPAPASTEPTGPFLLEGLLAGSNG